jgi:small ligand-binding sensory domain FIST
MSNQIEWINALSTKVSLEAAINEVVEKVTTSLSKTPDLGIVFISSAYTSDYPRLMPLLLEKLPLPCVIGCGGGGIVGMNDHQEAREIEGNPALSLTVANLPNVEITPFLISGEEIPDLDSPPQQWCNLVGVPTEKQPDFVLLADPFTSKINELIEGLDFAYPGSVKVGGLASASTMGVASALFFYSHSTSSEQFLFSQGTVGIALSGDITLETIVAQGCRAIGETYQVTQGERNVIIELSDHKGKKDAPLNLVRELVSSLSETDQQLAQHSLFIGIARDEFKLELGHGDFLIRNLVGVDPKYGAVAVGDRIRTGQRVKFHLRDGDASLQDLKTLLGNYQKNHPPKSACGALMFSCLGRGEGLYLRPNVDSLLFQDFLPNTPLGGFFCNGEIGPVGNSTFLHGYTSVFGIFTRK